MTDHIPVLLQPIIDSLLPDGRPIARVIDGTLGAGGHSRELLKNGVGHIMGLDVDTQALSIAKANLSDFLHCVTLKQSSYVQMQHEATALGWDSVDAILLDLGVSSMQFDTPQRGFSFREDAPLDMRFNPESDQPSAANLVNGLTVDDLSQIFFEYGEEAHAKRFARAIIESRPIHTTQQLAEIVQQATPKKRHRQKSKNIHPATRVFQALRIAVNDELQAIEQVLPLAIDLLSPGGRLAGY